MKRLLILTAVSIAASAAGCKCCGLCGGGGTQAYRPPCPTAGCGSGAAVQAYPAPGTYATPDAGAQPYMVPQTVPGGSYPGPEVYTPAN